jgi:hypothetical protein
LAGRQKILSSVAIALERIRNGLSAKSILMIGLRGVGKTVLLNRMKADAEASGMICVQFEVQENYNLPSVIIPNLRVVLLKLDRVAGMGDSVAKALRVLGSFISSVKLKFDEMEFGFDLGKESGVADTGVLDFDLLELLEAVGVAAKEKKTAVIILIDELQYVPEKQLGALISSLHNCAQKQLPIALVGAGLPQLVGNVGKAKSYAERLFDLTVIGALTDQEATEALQRPVEHHHVVFTDQAVQEIIRQTQGYPYFIQEWGSHSWSLAQSNTIDLDDVNAATSVALAQLDASFFRVRFDRCTPMEKNYMRAMAEINDPKPRSGDIAAIMKKEVNQLGPLRQSLIKKGMIYSPAHGDIVFTVPLFSDYMKRTMGLPE